MPSPRVSACSFCATGPVVSACVQKRTVGPAPETVAPIAPSSRRALEQRHRLREEVRAVGLVQAVLEPAADEGEVAAGQAERQQRAVCDVRDGVGERDRRGQRLARDRRAHRGVRDHEHRFQAVGRVKPGGLPVADDDEAAEQRRRGVIGMAFELGRVGEQVAVVLDQVRGRTEACDIRRRARAQAARERDRRADPEREAVGREQLREAADAEVAAVARDVEVRLDGEAAALDDLELDVQRERRAERVEAGAEVRRRGRARARALRRRITALRPARPPRPPRGAARRG